MNDPRQQPAPGQAPRPATLQPHPPQAHPPQAPQLHPQQPGLRPAQGTPQQQPQPGMRPAMTPPQQLQPHHAPQPGGPARIAPAPAMPAAAPAQTGSVAVVDADDDAIALMDAEDDLSTKVVHSKIKHAGKEGHAEYNFTRVPTKTGTGPCRIRTFHAKLSDQGLEYLDDAINHWLNEHPEIDVKFVQSNVGMFDGKFKDLALVVNVWY